MTHHDPKFDPKALGASLRASIVSDGGALKPSSRRQTVELVLDVSGSMAGTAMTELNAGVRAFVREFAAAEQCSLFEVGIITFESSVVEVVEPRHPAELVVPAFAALGFTAMCGGLTKAHEVVRRTLGAPKRLRSVVVVFSDGGPTDGDPLPVAMSLKNDADVIAIGLGDVNKPTLTAIATSPQHVHYAADPKALRHLFATIGSTLSKSKAALAGALAPAPTAGAVDQFASRRR